jgi:hypothetical protein
MKYLAHLFFLQCVLLLAVIQCGRESASPAPAPSYTPTPATPGGITPTAEPTKKPKDKEKALLEQNEADLLLIGEIMRGVE